MTLAPCMVGRGRPLNRLCREPLLMNDSVNKAMLRQLINTEQWERIGEIFGFCPKYAYVNGRRYFNWVSAPPSMMAVLHPRQKGEEVFKLPKPPTQRLVVPRLLEQRFESQKGLCFYCGKLTEGSKWTLDHKIPKSRGGRGPDNKVGCCATCNRTKGSMTVEEFLDTDYLPESRRKQLGFHTQPNNKINHAKKSHRERLDIPSVFRNGIT